jgi:hypothetical protein
VLGPGDEPCWCAAGEVGQEPIGKDGLAVWQAATEAAANCWTALDLQSETDMLQGSGESGLGWRG